MLKIIDVDYCGDYCLKLLFNDGVVKVANLLPFLEGEVFEPLKDKNQFIQYGLNRFTIEWANGADFAPEFLYEIGESA